MKNIKRNTIKLLHKFDHQSWSERDDENLDGFLDSVLEEDLGKNFVGKNGFPCDFSFPGKGKVFAHQNNDFVVAGFSLVSRLIEKFDKDLKISSVWRDGDLISEKNSEPLLSLEGRCDSILTLERTLLNIISHLSGIATTTKQFVDAVAGSSVKILDTRKTTPAIRQFEKYAVRCGGGSNHRFGFYDAMMIKDTYIDAFPGGLASLLEKLKSSNDLKLPVICEIGSISDLMIILTIRPPIKRILLDNMSPFQVKESVTKINGLYETEASGGINIETVREYAKTGVNYISIGSIVYGLKRIDLTMKTSTKQR